MSACLVTGRAGSGKSSVAAELNRRGLSAYDTDDVDGLSSWQVIATGTLITLADATNVDLAKYRWVWDPSVITALINSAQGDIFVYGGATNDFDFEHLFVKHFVLDVSPEIQTRRLNLRTNNDYAKDPVMYPKIIESQARHIKDATMFGVKFINADQPIEAVVDTIMENL